MVRLTVLASVIFVGLASTATAEKASIPTDGNVAIQTTAATAAREGDGKGKCGIQMAASYPIK